MYIIGLLWLLMVASGTLHVCAIRGIAKLQRKLKALEEKVDCLP